MQDEKYGYSFKYGSSACGYPASQCWLLKSLPFLSGYSYCICQQLDAVCIHFRVLYSTLSLCYCHAIFVTITLLYTLKSSIVLPPGLLFLFRFALSIWNPLWFLMNFISFFLVSWKMSLKHWWVLHWICRPLLILEPFPCINSAKPWTEEDFLISSVFFNLFLQSFKCFIVESLYTLG